MLDIRCNDRRDFLQLCTRVENSENKLRLKSKNVEAGIPVLN